MEKVTIKFIKDFTPYPGGRDRKHSDNSAEEFYEGVLQPKYLEAKYKRFKDYEEYKTYLMECNYNNFNELCKYEHPHRIMKRFNLSITLIHELFN